MQPFGRYHTIVSNVCGLFLLEMPFQVLNDVSFVQQKIGESNICPSFICFVLFQEELLENINGLISKFPFRQ